MCIRDRDRPTVDPLHPKVARCRLLQQHVAQLPVEIDERPLPLANDSLDKRLNQIVVTLSLIHISEPTRPY